MNVRPQTPSARLPDSVAVQCCELLRHAVTPVPDGANLSFKSKTIRGRIYHYLYLSLGRRRVEHYLGPEPPELLARREHARRRLAERDSHAGRRHIATESVSTDPRR